jgi:phosphatidylglycerophosphate synthase
MAMQKEKFGGDKKVGQAWTHGAEAKLVKWMLKYVPKNIETYHLTLATIPISALIVFFSYLAVGNIRWLWAVSFLIALQWLTDSLDGAVGRMRNTGLVKWGYFMDHFLDYVFLASILIGYLYIIPGHEFIKFFVFAIFVGFMINSYLSFATTNKFQVAYLGFGPTEARILFIIINTLLTIFGKTYLFGILPYVLIFSFLSLCIVIYREHKILWKMDMEEKNKKSL